MRLCAFSTRSCSCSLCAKQKNLCKRSTELISQSYRIKSEFFLTDYFKFYFFLPRIVEIMRKKAVCKRSVADARHSKINYDIPLDSAKQSKAGLNNSKLQNLRANRSNQAAKSIKAYLWNRLLLCKRSIFPL